MNKTHSYEISFSYEWVFTLLYSVVNMPSLQNLLSCTTSSHDHYSYSNIVLSLSSLGTRKYIELQLVITALRHLFHLSPSKKDITISIFQNEIAMIMSSQKLI
ncbi:hypothetical protein BCN_0530 [Bacillus cereus NC7401]|nr:hypothetical protein BCN_0530 [Bacillus cereus NC7401]